VLDRSNMRVELGRHVNPRLIRAMRLPMRGTRLAELHRPAKRLCKSGRGRRRGGFAGALQAARGTTINTIAEFLLSCAYLGQECDRVERPIPITQPFLHSRGHLGMRRRTLIGRRWGMIALDHFSAFAALLLQLERRLEEVDVEPCRRI